MILESALIIKLALIMGPFFTVFPSPSKKNIKSSPSSTDKSLRALRFRNSTAPTTPWSKNPQMSTGSRAFIRGPWHSSRVLIQGPGGVDRASRVPVSWGPPLPCAASRDGGTGRPLPGHRQPRGGEVLVAEFEPGPGGFPGTCWAVKKESCGYFLGSRGGEMN